MAFHVVTNRCFLACERVTSVVMEELVPDKPKPKKKRKKSKGYETKKTSAVPLEEIPSQFTITMSYYPLARTAAANGRGSIDETEYTLELRVLGEPEARRLYNEIIKEVQEQHPGEGYLDQLVSKLFEGDGKTDAVPEANYDDD